MIFVCKRLSSQSNFVIAKLWRPLVNGKCEEKWRKDTIQHWCCVGVLYQESSLAIFREMSLEIFRETSLANYRCNINLKLTDASAYKFIFWIYDINTCIMCNVMVLIFMKTTELGTCQENMNSWYRLLWPVQNSTYWHLMFKCPFIFFGEIYLK